VDLLAEGSAAEGIVAFTFTERAAAELKERITDRVEGRMGRRALDRLNGLFVGTIHAYCFGCCSSTSPATRPTTSSMTTS
jgi:DNA helicase-2/ATP-dependent DNA helicase PcrA